MNSGWSGSHVVFVVECGGGCSRGICNVALTPLWSWNARGMVWVSLLCKTMWRGSYIRKCSMHVACDGWCAVVKLGSCGPSNSVKGNVRRWQDLSEGLVQTPRKSPPRICVLFDKGDGLCNVRVRVVDYRLQVCHWICCFRFCGRCGG